ncbi:lipopolysaccharide-induced tumor necrosis factor-alpha factor homolog [Halichondria panicea]|uniref:lipopolysaccharide-induced tumor necrosis factor-alpha factor homolog n=1 Tax=Halichondria panicea TaxID=6063 RepID=UPI00312B4F86
MANEKAPLLLEQGAPPLATGYGEPQAPPPTQPPPPQAPPPQPQGPPPPQYSGQPQAPPPPGGQYGSYQNAPGYQNAPLPQQNTNTTVVVQNTAAPNPVLREGPAIVTCPNCRVQNRTNVSYTTGLFALILMGVLFLFGFWLCCWIPLVVDGCKDVTHTCPNCHYTVGTYKRL